MKIFKIISHKVLFATSDHLEGKRLGANGKRNDPITNLYCRVAIHPVDSAVIEVCTNLLTCTMRFAVAMQRSSPSKMIQGIKRRIYRIREVFFLSLLTLDMNLCLRKYPFHLQIQIVILFLENKSSELPQSGLGPSPVGSSFGRF